MQLRPLLASIYARDREPYLPADVHESLIDANDDDVLTALSASGPYDEDLARAYLVDTTLALIEDAVATLRAKSHAAAQLEPAPQGAAAEPSWTGREASWSVRALLRAMAMPRDSPRVPDDVYWGAVMIDACEHAVATASSARLVGAAVLKRLAEHEAMLDASLATLRAAARQRHAAASRKGSRSQPADGGAGDLPPGLILASLNAKPDAADLLRGLQRGSLTYAPPDARRLDGEIVVLARSILARNLAALAQGPAIISGYSGDREAARSFVASPRLGTLAARTPSVATGAPTPLQTNTELQQLLARRPAREIEPATTAAPVPQPAPVAGAPAPSPQPAPVAAAPAPSPQPAPVAAAPAPVPQPAPVAAAPAPQIIAPPQPQEPAQGLAAEVMELAEAVA